MVYRADIKLTEDFASIEMTSTTPEDKDSYEMNLPNGEGLLTSLFKKLNILRKPDTPVEDFTMFTQEVLDNGSGSFYVPKDNINSAISHYRHNAPAPDKLPDKNKSLEEPINFFVTEQITLSTPIYVNGTILKEGTKLRFFHKGYINDK